MALSGEPIPVADQVLSTNAVGVFTTSDSVLAYQTAPAGAGSRLTWFSRDGRPVAVVGGSADHADLRLSPDGNQALVSIATSVGDPRDLWRVDLASGSQTRVTSDPADEQVSVWSPDGRRVIFNSRRNGQWDVYQKASNGAGAETVLLADAFDKTPSSAVPAVRVEGPADAGRHVDSAPGW